MSIRSAVSDDGSAVTIHIDGRFDASSLEDFRHSYENVESQDVKQYIVDLGETIHLDSSALGMLLVLRDHAGGDNSDIVVSNCSPEIKKIFAISSFERLFTIA